MNLLPTVLRQLFAVLLPVLKLLTTVNLRVVEVPALNSKLPTTLNLLAALKSNMLTSMNLLPTVLPTVLI